MLNIRSVFDDRSAAAMGLNTFWSNIYGILETNLKSETTIVFLMKNYIEWLVQILISLDIGNFHFFHPWDFSGSFFWEFLWKNEVSQIDPGSFRDGPWSSRTSKNLQKSSNLPLGRPWGFRKKSEKFIRKHRSERLFGRIFSNFPMLAHVVSLRGDSRAFLSLSSDS